MGVVRLFIAVEPPSSALDALRCLPRPERRGLRWTGASTWHVTLRFLGEVDAPDVVVQALADADLGAVVTAQLGPETAWLSRNVLAVPVRGLDDLALRVREATAGIGKAPDGRAFRGHLTLARRRRRGPAVGAGEAIECRFVVEEIVLFSSNLSSAGATHEALHRFALADRA